MAPKQQLEKEAWKWADSTKATDITLENVQTAYRTKLKPCKKGGCRRNCKGSPLCLNFIGEQGWLGTIDERHWHDIEDPENERRPEGSSVGLKNLGATCYVNTFLQLWFHNPRFRNRILQWEEPNSLYGASLCYGPDNPSTSIDTPEQTPKSVVHQLQLIFAKLMFSKRRFVDPSDFIASIGLDTGEQQDAQEFSKLFTCLLEEKLSSHPNSLFTNLISEQFAGEYAYVTRCNVCNGGSDRSSKFLELDLNIKGNKDLDECIQEFLQEEKMENEDKYDCPGCLQKQNAVRMIQLRSLPPVLNLQLLRFVFDRDTGRKKKLNSYLRFPEELDLGKYIGKPEGEVVYDLSAVLIHRGQSAYSGHYIAHIKDRPTETWFKFNDEEIEKMGGKNLQLGCEDDIDETKAKKGKEKKPKVTKGSHCSKNAYMLVYNKRENNSEETQSIEEKTVSMTDLPEFLQKAINDDNDSFEKWIKDMIAMKDVNVAKGKEKQAEIIEMYSMMHFDQGDAFEWISSDWFPKWFADELTQSPPIDNTGLLCQHNKLNPDKTDQSKCISGRAAELLFAKYGGDVRLKGEDCFCWDCIRERCQSIHTKVQIAEDNKFITAALKDKSDLTCVENSYWVGKQSLRSWRRLAMEKFEEKKTTKSETSDNGTAPEDPEMQNGSSVDGKMECEPSAATSDEYKNGTCEPSTSGDKNFLEFNEDAACLNHGKSNLEIDEGWRRLVPGAVWERLKKYFPDAPEFIKDAEPCHECLLSMCSDKESFLSYKEAATQQKAALNELFLDRNRPHLNKWNQLFLISKEFLDKWKHFIREKGNAEPVKALCNKILLCEHGRFLYNVASNPSNTNAKFVYLKQAEWDNLSKFVDVDVEIFVTRITEDSGVSIMCFPETCTECSEIQKVADFEAKHNYSDAKVYVRKITAEEGKDMKILTSGDTSFLEDYNEPPEKMAKMDVRRSSRRRLPRGTKEIDITPDMTLRDLKKRVWPAFKIMVSDQHLILNGKELKGEGEKLKTLNVSPDTVLFLLADEASNEDPDYLDDGKASVPESGFKGTGLLGGVTS